MSNIPEIVSQTLRDKRADLVRQREDAVRKIDKQISDIDSFLLASEVPTAAEAPKTKRVTILDNINARLEGSHENLSARFMNKLAITQCKQILAGGRQMKTPELYAVLESMNIKLRAEDPEARLSQLLSGEDDFVSDRKNGWSLKSEGLIGVQTDGPSSATTSTPDN